ncbi:aquaporin [Candidatus Woesebacteria bacterium]|nr:aquaporin [Candidatus Woesebacteria bacterium]
MVRKNFIEFIGTFFLVLTVGLSQNPFAIGGVLAALVYMGGYISGAHFNPAVTLALLLNKKIDMTSAIQYWVVQMAGGVAAAALVGIISGTAFAPTIPTGSEMGASLLVETLFTFLLAFVVLHVAATKKTEGNQYYGAAIGITLMTAAFVAGPISGGAINPAVGAAPHLLNIMKLGENLPTMGLYLIGPLAGGFFAGMVYKMLEPVVSK